MVWPLIGIGGAAFLAGCSRGNANGAKIRKALYKGFGLPDHGKIPADQNDLTKMVDGNTDSNRDGKIDDKDKNGFIETEELFEEVFSHREKYQALIKALYSAGLEDPLEESQEIKDYLADLFGRYKPKTDMGKAILVFRAVIPSTEKFTFNGKEYKGLTLGEGGLEIPANSDCKADLRFQFGDILPKELIASSWEERVSLCNEYSQLLAALLKGAGIKFHLEQIADKAMDHVYVVIEIKGSMYKLDATIPVIEKCGAGRPLTEREIIAGHYENEATFLWGQRRLDEALASNDIAFQIDPNDSATWSNKGMIFLTLNQIDKAIECFKKAIETDPHDGIALCNYGQILVTRGQNAQAMAYFDRSIKARPGYASPWLAKGTLLIKQGKENEGLRCFEAAYRVDPSDPDAGCTMGEWYLIHQDYTEAMKYYSKVLEQYPRNVAALLGQANCLFGTGFNQEGLKCLDDAIKSDPTDKEALYMKGTVLAQAGLLKESIQYFKRALKKDPKYTAAWNNLGNAYYKLGKLKKAMWCCDKALNIDPMYARPWYNKAQIFATMGEGEAAERCMRRFQQLSNMNVQ